MDYSPGNAINHVSVRGRLCGLDFFLVDTQYDVRPTRTLHVKYLLAVVRSSRVQIHRAGQQYRV
jgi:hypothetical protein